jgi:hypothetical protein
VTFVEEHPAPLDFVDDGGGHELAPAPIELELAEQADEILVRHRRNRLPLDVGGVSEHAFDRPEGM